MLLTSVKHLTTIVPQHLTTFGIMLVLLMGETDYW